MLKSDLRRADVRGTFALNTAAMEGIVVLTADSIVNVKLSEGAELLGSTDESVGVCFEGSAENAEMRCQSAAGEVGYKGCEIDADCLDPAYDADSQSNMHCYVASGAQSDLVWVEPCPDSPGGVKATTQGAACATGRSKSRRRTLAFVGCI